MADSPVAAPLDDVHAGPARRAARPSRRRVAFRIAAAAFPFVALAAANLGLYLTDVGVNTEFLLRVHKGPKSAHYLNPKADIVYGLFDLRGPEPCAFDLPKPANAFRVIVVGESSVQGYPYSSELAFPRQLQLVLTRQIPERKIEVLNAGIVGISTTPLMDVVSHVVAAAPDLIVVYAGHNEFYGIGGVASNAPAAPWQFTVRRYRLAQALMSPPKAAGPGNDLISTLPKQLEIAVDDPLVRQAEEMYRRNVAAIVDCCERAQVPVLMCGIVSNLRDQSPRLGTDEGDPLDLGHMPATDETSGKTTDDETPSDVRANPAVAWRSKCETACRSDPENAVSHYRLAQACEAEGDRPAALAAYTRARDLDVCRYRAPSKFRDVARAIAEGRASPAVRFLDLAPAFEAVTEFPAPGSDLFLEHVHFNLEGHWLVARTLGRFIVEEFLTRHWTTDAIPSREERDEWLGALPEDQLTAHVLALLLTKEAPFDRALEARRHQAELGAKIRKLTNGLTGDQQRRLFGLSHQTKIDDLVDGLGRSFLEARAYGAGLRYFQLGQRRRPWMPNSHVFAAVCLQRLGRTPEALEALKHADESCLLPLPSLQRVRDELESEFARSAAKH